MWELRTTSVIGSITSLKDTAWEDIYKRAMELAKSPESNNSPVLMVESHPNAADVYVQICSDSESDADPAEFSESCYT